MNIIRTILLAQSQFYQEHGKKATDLWVGPTAKTYLNHEARLLYLPPSESDAGTVKTFAGLTLRDMSDEGIRVGISMEATL